MTDNDVNGVAGICAGDTIFFGCLVITVALIFLKFANTIVIGQI